MCVCVCVGWVGGGGVLMWGWGGQAQSQTASWWWQKVNPVLSLPTCGNKCVQMDKQHHLTEIQQEYRTSVLLDVGKIHDVESHC